MALGRRAARGNDHFGVLLMPRAHIDEIGPFLVEHFAVIGVAVFLIYAEKIAEFGSGIGVGIGQCGNLGRLSGDAEPAASMHPGDGAAGDDGRAVLGHEKLLLV